MVKLVALAVVAAVAGRGVVTGPFVTPSCFPLLLGGTAWEAGLTAPEGDVLTSAALARKSNPPLSMLLALLAVGIRHSVGMHATSQVCSKSTLRTLIHCNTALCAQFARSKIFELEGGGLPGLNGTDGEKYWCLYISRKEERFPLFPSLLP